MCRLGTHMAKSTPYCVLYRGLKQHVYSSVAFLNGSTDTCVHTHAWMHTTPRYARTHAHTHYTHARTHAHTHTRAWMYTNTQVCTHACTHTLHSRTHTRTHTHLQCCVAVGDRVEAQLQFSARHWVTPPPLPHPASPHGAWCVPGGPR